MKLTKAVCFMEHDCERAHVGRRVSKSQQLRFFRSSEYHLFGMQLSNLHAVRGISDNNLIRIVKFSISTLDQIRGRTEVIAHDWVASGEIPKTGVS